MRAFVCVCISLFSLPAALQERMHACARCFQAAVRGFLGRRDMGVRAVRREEEEKKKKEEEEREAQLRQVQQQREKELQRTRQQAADEEEKRRPTMQPATRRAEGNECNFMATESESCTCSENW